MDLTLPAPPAIVPVGHLCGSAVLDSAGAKLGSITEVMVDTALGMIAYVVLTRGGVLGLGEKLYAVPFTRIAIDAASGTVTSTLTADELDALDGFNKDAWPVKADPALDRRAGGFAPA